jgi:ATP-dependent RNA helicase RhlE
MTGIRELADSLLHNPAQVEVARRNTPAERVAQVVHPVDRERKRELLSFMIGSQNWRQVLVFTRTKHGANRLSQQLEQDGIRSAAIHGNKSQAARTRALADFKAGAVRVLVATDIAARGLDIDQLPHVVNYELPNVPEDYVHRIGRTGRAGNDGQAVSLVCVDERKLLVDIERLLKRDLPKVEIAGYEVNPAIRAEPLRKPNARSAINQTAKPRAGQHRQARTDQNNGPRNGRKPAAHQARSPGRGRTGQRSRPG